MLYKNNIGPQVRRKRYALGWSQSTLAAKLQIAGLDISRSGVSKIEARLRYVDDKSIMFLAEVLKAPCRNSSQNERAAVGCPTLWKGWKRRDSDRRLSIPAMAP